MRVHGEHCRARGRFARKLGRHHWCAGHLGVGDHVIGVRGWHSAMRGHDRIPPINPYVCVDEDAEQCWLLPLREVGISCDLLILPDQRLGALLQVVEARRPDMIVMAKIVRGTLHDVWPATSRPNWSI
jgi:hypothetical protein